jgi:hypothetical protein
MTDSAMPFLKLVFECNSFCGRSEQFDGNQQENTPKQFVRDVYPFEESCK